MENTKITNSVFKKKNSILMPLNVFLFFSIVFFNYIFLTYICVLYYFICTFMDLSLHLFVDCNLLIWKYATNLTPWLCVKPLLIYEELVVRDSPTDSFMCS